MHWSKTPQAEEIRNRIKEARAKQLVPPRSEESKRLMSLRMKGNKNAVGKKSEEHKRKISEAHKRIGSPWLVGKKRIFTEQHRHNMSLSRIGKTLSEEQKRKIFTPEFLKRKSEAQKGEKGSNWKGGLTSIHHAARASLEYRIWRKAVFERDRYMCVIGGKEHGNSIEADHIKRFSDYPELRFKVSNGRTLCKSCHKKTDTYGRKKPTPALETVQ